MISKTMLVALALLLPIGAHVSAGGEPNGATRMRITEPGVEKVEIEKLNDVSPKFVLRVQKEVPTPGYVLRVDSVDFDEEPRRIRVKITETAPEGIVSQVISSAQVVIPLGQPQRGPHFVELSVRRGTDGDYRPWHALVIEGG